MHRLIFVTLSLLGLSVFIQTSHSFANKEISPENAESGDTYDVMNKHTEHEHAGLQRNLGFSNFFEGWTTQWKPYEESKNKAPRVPLLRIVPAFFSREIRSNYIFTNEIHHEDTSESELSFSLELPLTLRLKIDIEPKLLYVNTDEHGDSAGFGDTKFALRGMLLENERVSLSTGFTIQLPIGDDDRELGEGITNLGQEIALWMDLGHCISLQTFFGGEVPTGGEGKKDSNFDFLFGVALAKTFPVEGFSILKGITPFIEFNGRKRFDLGEGKEYQADLLPGVRWELCRELYVLQGFEIPLNGTEEFDKRVFFGVIKDF